jgi:hypothetical protein
MTAIDSRSKTSGQKPRLSLIACSRNDQWQGNSLWRLETTINYTALQAAKLDRLDEIEIIISDWGSNETLRDAVKLIPEAMQVVRYLNIPPALAKEKQKDSPFAEVFALNAAARRSRGEYIGRIDQDTLVGRPFFEWFFAATESPNTSFAIESTAMISNRRRIPYDFAVRCLPFPLVEKYLDLFRRALPRMPQRSAERYWEVYVGIVLMHRKLWEAAGGYDETFIYYGCMEFELFLRLLRRFAGFDISTLVGYNFYHLDHVKKWLVWEDLTRPLNPERTPKDPPLEFRPNGDGWGLADYDIPLLGPPPDALLANSEIKWRPSMLPKLIWYALDSTIMTLYRRLSVRQYHYGSTDVEVGQNRDRSHFDANDNWQASKLVSTDILRGSYPLEGDPGKQYAWLSNLASLTLVPKFPPKRLIIDYNYPLDTLSKSDPRFSKMEIELFVNGRKVTARTIDKDGSDQIAADVSQLAISAGDDVEIHIVADKALMPSAHGLNDKRLLSMIVSKIYFD